MTDKEHGETIRAARDALNEAVISAKTDGLDVNFQIKLGISDFKLDFNQVALKVSRAV